MEDPRANITKLTQRANDLLRAKHENSMALFQNFLSDGTMLVMDSSNRGKASPTFIDSAWWLGTEELQTIDDFVQDMHNRAARNGTWCRPWPPTASISAFWPLPLPRSVSGSQSH